MMIDQLACDRRAALAACGVLLGLAAGGSSAAVGLAARGSGRAPVIAYFGDGLLRDPSGTLPPYLRPAGYRGGAGAARLDEAGLREAGIIL